MMKRCQYLNAFSLYVPPINTSIEQILNEEIKSRTPFDQLKENYINNHFRLYYFCQAEAIKTANHRLAYKSPNAITKEYIYYQLILINTRAINSHELVIIYSNKTGQSLSGAECCDK